MKVETIDITDPTLLGANEAALNYVSMDVSTLSLTIAADTIFDDCPFVQWKQYRIVYEGKTVMVGICTQAKQDTDGGAVTWSVVVSDYFCLLKNAIFLNSPQDGSGDDYYKARRSSLCKVMVGEGKVQIWQNMTMVCAVAANNLLPFTHAIDIDNTAELVPYASSTNSYSGMLSDLLKWRPNAAGWFSYEKYDKEEEDSSPGFNICDQGKMIEYAIDLKRDKILSMSINPRPDLVPPAVGFVSTTQAKQGQACYILNCYPPGADLRQPGCVIAEFNLEAEQIEPSTPGEEPTDEEKEADEENRRKKASRKDNLQKMRVRGKKMPQAGEAGAEFWIRNHSRLANCGGMLTCAPAVITVAPISGNEGSGYSADATGYELVEGMVGPDTPTLKWSEVILKQRVRYNGKPPKEVADLFPLPHTNGTWIGEFEAQVRTIGSIGGTYVIGGDGAFYPGDQEPPEDEEEEEGGGSFEPYDQDRYKLYNAAKSYYEGTRILPYEGEMVKDGVITQPLLGRVINISGGRPEWENMKALVQSYGVNLMTRETSIKMGPPSHLSLDDMISRSDSIMSGIERTAAETAESTEDTKKGNPYQGSGSYNWEKKKHPNAPGVGPMCKILSKSPATLISEMEFDFQARVLYGDDGLAVGLEVKHGRTKCLFTGGEAYTGSGWVKMGQGKVYCNISVDKDGNHLKSELATTPISYRPLQFPPDGMDSQHPDFEKYRYPGYYSYLIAELMDGKSIQHHVGTIMYDYRVGGSPMSPSSP